jgi:hypothetical protein
MSNIFQFDENIYRLSFPYVDSSDEGLSGSVVDVLDEYRKWLGRKNANLLMCIGHGEVLDLIEQTANQHRVLCPSRLRSCPSVDQRSLYVINTTAARAY